ncbi:hypothetical protein MRB53_026682 [Persea americana]|uniref:Uncharacterized protein n=1 Tax=Persea americana TaxID=3435 RepID=A0ACC2LIU9_PERAE|nr:hypothetical protein MRB53_026682 [Persea americana]
MCFHLSNLLLSLEIIGSKGRRIKGKILTSYFSSAPNCDLVSLGKAAARLQSSPPPLPFEHIMFQASI